MIVKMMAIRQTTKDIYFAVNSACPLITQCTISINMHYTATFLLVFKKNYLLVNNTREGQKKTIKIRNTARLSCNLKTVILMV